MKITGETIRIDSSPVAADGSKLEPEERTAIEIESAPVDAKVGTGPTDGTMVGQMKGSIVRASDAIDVARDAATRCDLCEHWRRADYVRHLDAISTTHEGQQQIERLRGMLLGLRKPTENPDDDLDSDVISTAHSIDAGDLLAVNIAIRNDFAICAAFTESTGAVTITPSYGGCPETDPRFKARDRATKIEASSRYDSILRLAQGRS